MAVFVPDEKAIQALASPEVFNRGKNYWNDGAVSGLVRRGDVLSASVDGSEDEPYAVSVTFSGKTIADSDCTCPFEFGGACKHVVAALLAYRAKPGNVKVSPPIAELLAKLDRDRLQALLMKRLGSDHSLAGWLEAQLAVEPGRGGAADPKPIARQAHALLRQRYRNRNYWDGYSASGEIEELQQLTEAAVPLLEAGDGRGALDVLLAVTGTFVEDWIEYSSGQDEHMYEIFNDLGRMIAEAALLSDLDDQERVGFTEIVDGWRDDLADYSVEGAFDPAILALEMGWDAPGLAEALAGKNRSWQPDDEDDWNSGEVIAVMLRVLDAQDRKEEYLNLARATGRRAQYGAMLVQLGRTREAVAYGLTEVKEPEQALTIAKALDAASATADALAVAKHGIGLAKSSEREWSHGRHDLACWLRDRAVATDRHELASIGARVAFELSLALADYRTAKTAAGAAWPELRVKLLGTLAAASDSSDRIAIYLEEEMVDEAVRAAGQAKNFSPHDDVLLRLAAAARRSHPQWVIELATRMSAGIMDNNQAGYYDLAARWLEQAMRAFDDDGCTDDWLEMIGRLIETHRRKHKLRPLLEALRAGTFSHA